jgi:hypothetical protein
MRVVIHAVAGRRPAAAWAVGWLCLALAGCGGPAVGRVTGKVTAGGRPVTQGTIMFIPADGRAAVGQIAGDGTYNLTTIHPGDGALVGSHKVTIHATKVGAATWAEPTSLEAEIKLSKGQKVLVPGKVEWLVPERYSRLETTDLTASVRAGDNTIDFDLPAK